MGATEYYSNCWAITAIYADAGILGYLRRPNQDASDRQQCFTWCRLPRKIHVDVGMSFKRSSLQHGIELLHNGRSCNTTR
eukprot:4535083-Pleurochrysis_carterae.AAC.2